MRAILLEPDAGGRISGGYLYNARIAQFSRAVERRAMRVDRFEADLDELDLPDDAWLIADSLFLSPQPIRALERVCRNSRRRRAMLLHAFPSFVRRGDQRDPMARAPFIPTREELDLLETLDLVLAPGPLVPRLLAASGASVRAAICPPGVDPRPEPIARSARRGPVQLVSIGSVTPLKGFIDGAEALGRLGRASFHWTIVGHLGVAPECVEQLRSRIQELGLKDRVEFAGQRDHADTLALLRASDLLLMTSITENHPLVALEALAAGVPIVGYAVGGLPDIVRDGDAGLLSPVLDVAHLARNLARLIEHPSERERLSDGCVRAATALPTWPEAARSFERCLESHDGHD